MVEETILQHWIFTRFALPFLLVFFIVFAVLEKTNLFGKEKKQLNALVAFIIGMIFVSVIYPTLVVNNLILFLTISMVVVFVGMLLWGFLTGGEPKISGPKIKIAAGIILVIVIIGAVLWATGFYKDLLDTFFKQEWSNTFWTNFAFIVVAAIALALVIGKKAGGGEGK